MLRKAPARRLPPPNNMFRQPPSLRPSLPCPAAARVWGKAVTPASLTFYQAPDGCLHAVFTAAAAAGNGGGAAALAAPVAAASTPAAHHGGGCGRGSAGNRSLAPQPAVARRAAGVAGTETFGALARRLCVNP